MINQMQIFAVVTFAVFRTSHGFSFLIDSQGKLVTVYDMGGLRGSMLFATSPSNNVDTAFGPHGYNFSSRIGWDQFYSEDDEKSVFEWHSELDNEDIVTQLLEYSKDFDGVQSHLLVGTGNSMLPRVLYDRIARNTQEQIDVTCLDYSKACIDNLRKAHESACPGMRFIHGDATKLQSLFQDDDCGDDHDEDNRCNDRFHTIIDKGLLDALMCSEGWNGPVTEVLQGAASVVCDNGKYILISYKLPLSTKDFFREVTKGVFEWNFDVPKVSSERISFSVATRIKR